MWPHQAQGQSLDLFFQFLHGNRSRSVEPLESFPVIILCVKNNTMLFNYLQLYLYSTYIAAATAENKVLHIIAIDISN